MWFVLSQNSQSFHTQRLADSCRLKQPRHGDSDEGHRFKIKAELFVDSSNTQKNL